MRGGREVQCRVPTAVVELDFLEVERSDKTGDMGGRQGARALL